MKAEKVIAYVRVSTDEQADRGAGLDAQREAIQTEVDRRGWTDIVWIEDRGRSGKDTNRPGLTEARHLLAQKTGPRALVVAKMDRLSRSLLDFASIMGDAQRQGWSLVALDCPADPSTPAGEAMVAVMAVFAQLERRMIGQRTKDALAAKKAAGVSLGRPRAIPAAIAARIRAERQSGSTLTAIADRLTADGVPTAHGGRRWYASTVSYALKAST